jgi:hypothetical protein
MKFMTMVRSREGLHQAAPAAIMQAIAGLAEEAGRAGVFVTMGGLLPLRAGAVARLTEGKITVTDGPFAEAKEVIGGYAIYETKTKAEALEWTRRFLDIHRQHWPEWEGEVEVRQLMEPPSP